MTSLKNGDRAPDFSGIDQEGRKVSLKDFKGNKLVLYFYPKDDTPGCTAEACNLRDNYDTLLKKGFQILGVSADSEESHKKFISKYVLPFPLIADKDKKIIHDYGIWGEKKRYGKIYQGILRTTFIINEDGIIEKVIGKVDTKNHTEQIIID
ncbi:MAG: thioredoxin-dependent thiol peroxidase [Bacteroidetes bacterium]|nr:thioredoxin-dependent thiol peroxidase [Bacteroidota bacterium]